MTSNSLDLYKSPEKNSAKIGSVILNRFVKDFLFVCLFICLFICLFVCLFVYNTELIRPFYNYVFIYFSRLYLTPAYRA